MSASLFTGRTVHARLSPFRHRFAYRLWMVRADIDAPPRAWLFRTKILSLSPRDHGPRDGSALRPWVEAQLAEAGIDDAAARIELMAMPRLLGWVFNPISLYLCHRADGSLGAVLYETKNTFGDQHAYVARLDGNDTQTHTARKRLHVSPFFDMQGGYRFALSADDERLSLLIRLDAAGGTRLIATLSGRFAPLGDAALLRALAGMPFVNLKVWLLIHFQALKLWRRGAIFHRAPAPPDHPSSAASTVKAGMDSLADRLPEPHAPTDPRLRLALHLAGLIQRGQLRLVMPNGSAHVIDGGKPGPVAEVRIRDVRLPGRFLTGGSLAWAEAYVDGWWDSPDIRAVMALAAANEAEWERLLNGKVWARALSWLAHRLKPNTRRGSRRNISAHYDMGNDFYALWLDPTLSYSSAIFADAAEPLETAQARKVDALCQALALSPQKHLLEIGCGWGFLAQTAAQKYGARVTAITLSREQHDEAARRIAAAGLADRVAIRIQDYRDVGETYDAIASVEMIEAVGEKYWPKFFRTLHDRLKPGGVAGIQAITIDERFWPIYRSSADFIQRHIFPGGMLPTKTAIRTHAASVGLACETASWFGQCYAATLAHWHDRFQHAWPRIAALPHSPTGLAYDARFKRLWEYYLTYCETGFRAGWTDVGQVILRKPA